MIIRGLEAIHNKGIIHRDLKPGNIFVFNQGVLKIGDFGISKKYSFATSTDTVKNNTTLLFMSPEVILGNRHDEKVDIWAAGVILYYACTLKFPFGNEASGMSIRDIISSSEYKELPDNYSPQIKELLKQCLQKDPKKRLSAAQILESDLAMQYAQ